MFNKPVRVKCEDVGTLGQESLENLLRFCESRAQSKSSGAFWINCQPSPMPSRNQTNKALLVMKVQHRYEV